MGDPLSIPAEPGIRRIWAWVGMRAFGPQGTAPTVWLRLQWDELQGFKAFYSSDGSSFTEINAGWTEVRGRSASAEQGYGRDTPRLAFISGVSNDCSTAAEVKLESLVFSGVV